MHDTGHSSASLGKPSAILMTFGSSAKAPWSWGHRGAPQGLGFILRWTERVFYLDPDTGKQRWHRWKERCHCQHWFAVPTNRLSSLNIRALVLFFQMPGSESTSKHAIFFIKKSAVPLLDKTVLFLCLQEQSMRLGTNTAPELVRPVHFAMGCSPQEPFLSWTLLLQLSLLPASIPKSPQSDSWVSHKGRGGRFIFQPHYCPDFGEGRTRSVALNVYLRSSRWVVGLWALVCVGGTHKKDWQLCCSGLSTASLAAGLAQVSCPS